MNINEVSVQDALVGIQVFDCNYLHWLRSDLSTFVFYSERKPAV